MSAPITGSSSDHSSVGVNHTHQHSENHGRTSTGSGVIKIDSPELLPGESVGRGTGPIHQGFENKSLFESSTLKAAGIYILIFGIGSVAGYAICHYHLLPEMINLTKPAWSPIVSVTQGIFNFFSS